VSGRIVIDIHGHQKHTGGLKRTENKERQQLAESSRADGMLINVANQAANGGNTEAAGDSSVYIQRLSDEEQQRNKREMLEREQDLIFVSPMLPGFSLKDKRWSQYLILSDSRMGTPTLMVLQ